MKLPDHVSESVKRRNPQLYPGALGTILPTDRKQSPEPALVNNVQTKQKVRRGVEVCVSIIACRRRVLDSDNAIAGAKHLRDCIAKTLGIDDSDRRVRWQYGQVETRGKTGTIVMIEQLRT